MRNSAAPARLLIIGSPARLDFLEQWPGRRAVPVFWRGNPGRGAAERAGQLQASGARPHPSSGLVRDNQCPGGEPWPALSLLSRF